MRKICFSIGVFFLVACNVIKKENTSSIDKVWELPYELEEVSGISSTDKENVVALVQDEEGKVFFYDLNEERVVDVFDFGKDGDYEGIEKVGVDYWVLRSDGTLFQIVNIGTENQQTVKHKTPLSEENDCEGLAFDAENNCLLIACKGRSSIKGKPHKKRRSIYAFNLLTNKLDKSPVIEIHLKDIEIKNDNIPLGFAPSAIAVNALKNEIFLLSSVGNSLVVTNYSGEIIELIPLDEYDFKQPEGLLILDNKLLISNEGRGTESNLTLYEKDI